jgi:hypothetical protein
MSRADAHELPYPRAGNGSRWVPWTAYLADRERDERRWDRIESKLDVALERLGAHEVAKAVEEGQTLEQARQAAAAAARRQRWRDRLWDVVRLVIAAGVGAVAAYLGLGGG